MKALKPLSAFVVAALTGYALIHLLLTPAQAQMSPGKNVTNIYFTTADGGVFTAGTGLSMSGFTISCVNADAGVTGCLSSDPQIVGGLKEFTGKIGVGQWPTGQVDIIGPGQTTPNVLLTAGTSSSDSACITFKNQLGTSVGSLCWGNAGLSGPYVNAFNFNSLNAVSPSDWTWASTTKGGEVARLTSANGTFSTQAASGQAAYTSLQGARTQFDGATGAKYMSSDGTNLTVTGLGVISSTSGFGLAGHTPGNFGIDESGSNTRINAGGSVVLLMQGAVNNVGVSIIRETLPTCNSSNEGLIATNGAAGQDGGSRTQLCMCTSDGTATPTYAWMDLTSGTVGNTTTCNH